MSVMSIINRLQWERALGKATKSDNHFSEEVFEPISKKPIRALTEAQGHYILAIQRKTLTFGVGPAGTGKTLIPVSLAADALVDKVTERIIFTRPVVEAGNTLGFLPGELAQKYTPYMTPVLDVLTKRLGKSQLDYAIKAGYVRTEPLELMRGMTFNDCWCILDEAQNVTAKQMLMFLTRIGRNCKVIITGDPDQCDLRDGTSGFEDAIDRCCHLPDSGAVFFGNSDIVRSGIVKDILIAYSTKKP